MNKYKVIVWVIVIASLLGFVAYFLGVGGVTNKEADFIVKEAWVSAGKYEWAKQEGISITYGDSTSQSNVENNKMLLNISQGEEDLRRDAIFELGHFLFMRDFCPKHVKGTDLRIVCELYGISPPAVVYHHCMQSHIYAREFLNTKGNILVDDKFLKYIQFYDKNSADLQGISSVCK